MKKQITEATLIEIANERLRTTPGYEEGMKVHSAKMEKHLLVLTGEFFLDDGASPTPRTLKVMPIYEELTNSLGSEFTVL